MTDQHRATPEQWDLIAETDGGCMSATILELRARVEALEARQPATEWLPSTARLKLLHGGSPAVSADPAPASEPPPLDVPQSLARDWINRHGTFRTVSTGGQRERTGTDWGMVITEAARWGQRQGWDARAAAEPPAVKESLTAPPAHTIAECGGPCEDDFRLCDCGLLQPLKPQSPSSKRLWRAMEEAGRRDLDDNPHAELAEFYEAMIRAVADWLEARGNRGSAAELREEANRA